MISDSQVRMRLDVKVSVRADRLVFGDRGEG